MMGIRHFVAAVVVLLLVAGLMVYGDAQQQTYRQTDPNDIEIRQKIDSDLYGKLWRMDREIQIDTVLLESGTSQTIQLPHKFEDAGFEVFIQCRVDREYTADMCVTPSSDSSFTITKGDLDLSTIHYMAIHKGD